ncbi:MAG TPA: 2-phospho-L-lactate guanylyltransferase [Hyphomicrobiaceae bacterium]|nr:2-phospho-L-lactate guanylyltransferase [Hyphomicrobiaceae bacterium]
MSTFWIIVPVKDTRQSKQRLGGLLTDGQRQQLAHVMLEEVLSAIAPLRSRAPCMLVTVDSYALSLAERFGMRVTEQGAHDGHTGAVDGGRRLVASEGARGMLTMPGDIPLVTTGEIVQVLDAHDAAKGFSIVPAGDQMGSNAVACSPPLAVPLRFGENSFFPHLDAARAAGLEPVVQRLRGIGIDVDTPSDVARLAAADPEARSRTCQYLHSIGALNLGAGTEATG